METINFNRQSVKELQEYLKSRGVVSSDSELIISNGVRPECDFLHRLGAIET